MSWFKAIVETFSRERQNNVDKEAHLNKREQFLKLQEELIAAKSENRRRVDDLRAELLEAKAKAWYEIVKSKEDGLAEWRDNEHDYHTKMEELGVEKAKLEGQIETYKTVVEGLKLQAKAIREANEAIDESLQKRDAQIEKRLDDKDKTILRLEAVNKELLKVINDHLPKVNLEKFHIDLKNVTNETRRR